MCAGGAGQQKVLPTGLQKEIHTYLNVGDVRSSNVRTSHFVILYRWACSLVQAKDVGVNPLPKVSQWWHQKTVGNTLIVDHCASHNSNYHRSLFNAKACVHRQS
mmetsp:Transcript_22495/g.29729  ORF Transcript_22495/g.29729 Transcript_22495/m.29729 type:complete len:104 (+) Transcript_22495:342-653(+)